MFLHLGVTVGIIRKVGQLLLLGVDRLLLLSGGIGAVLIFGMTVITVYDTFMRYALNKPSMWRMDVSMAFLLGFSLLAFGYTQREKFHIRMSVVTNYLPPRVRKIETVIMNFVCVAICGLLAYPALLLFDRAQEMHELSWNLILPMAPVKLCFIIGLIMWGLALVRENIDLLQRARE